MYATPQHAVRALIVVLLFFSAFCVPAFAAQTPRGDFEERRRAVAAAMETATVWIVVEDDETISSGSGFLVGDGYIMTNAHVIANMDKDSAVYVLNERIPMCKAHVVAADYSSPKEGKVGGKDFALLRFTPPKGEPLPVPVLSTNIKRMDRVSAWGYPTMATQFDITTERLQRGDTRGLAPPPVIYTEGSVNAIVQTRLSETILHSAQIARGNSGGPLVNGRGEVVGINTWGYKEDGEGAFLNMAQPAGELIRFLMDNGVTPRLAEGERPPPARTVPESAGGVKTAEKQRPPEPSGQQGQDSRLRNVGSFSVQVPPNWSVLEEETDSILIGSDDRASVVGIMVVTSKGKTLRQVAEALAEKLDGNEPELDDDVYAFTFADDGIDALAVVGEGNYEDSFVVIMLFGDMQKPGVEEILDSVEDA